MNTYVLTTKPIRRTRHYRYGLFFSTQTPEKFSYYILAGAKLTTNRENLAPLLRCQIRQQTAATAQWTKIRKKVQFSKVAKAKINIF